MGVARNGRFAAVTNYRGATEPAAAESRGALVSRFLTENIAPGNFLSEIQKRANAYSGFNLLVANEDELWWFSNRDGTPRRLEPGVYGLGNLLLDSPEVKPAKEEFAATIGAAPAAEALFTGLARAKIIGAEYGTRCSTVLLKGEGRSVRYAERSFSADGAGQETLQYQFQR